MADENDEKGAGEELTPEEEAAKAKKKKIIIIAGAAVLLLALLGGGAMMFLGGGDKDLAAKSAEGEAGEAAAPGEEGAEEGSAAGPDGETAGAGAQTAAAPDDETGAAFGCTFPLKPFHLNLGNPLENRYLRLEIAIEYKCSEEHKLELEKRTPQLRDAVIGITSKKTREFLLGPDGKAQLRKEVVTRVNHYMDTKVDDVFITDILIE